MDESKATTEETISAASKQGMRNAILCQCFGTIGRMCFGNGLILLYFLALGIDEARVLVYLSLFGICEGGFLIFAALFADRVGMKRCGNIGAGIQTIGFFLLIPPAMMIGNRFCEPLIVVGTILFGIGATLFMAPWFPLLKGIVPESMRGRFFGKLRISWQVVGLIFSAIAAVLIDKLGNFPGYPILWVLVVIMMSLRSVFYVKIPELNDAKPVAKSEEKIVPVILDLIRRDGYASFSSYVFLLALFTASCPSLFAMVEKEFLKLDSGTVVWLSNLLLIGSLIGYYLGGRAVDRLGTKAVFMFCHFSFALFMIVFLFRGWIPAISLPVMGFAHFGFGLVFASSTIAVTTETIVLLPVEHQSLATAVLRTTDIAGRGISGIACALILKLGVLQSEWVFLGMPMSRFDAILLACAGMVVLMVITLGLVPSVLRPDPNRMMT